VWHSETWWIERESWDLREETSSTWERHLKLMKTDLLLMLNMNWSIGRSVILLLFNNDCLNCLEMLNLANSNRLRNTQYLNHSNWLRNRLGLRLSLVFRSVLEGSWLFDLLFFQRLLFLWFFGDCLYFNGNLFRL